MFDNPKKELERLQAQLLAAEVREPEEPFEDDIYNESGSDELLDDDLYAVLYEDQALSRRSAGIEDEYEMDGDRYVPAPKKKGIGGLLFISFLELVAAAALIGWWLGWLS